MRRNKEGILELADELEKLSDGPGQGSRYFDMKRWKEPLKCGTACCIGGFAEMELGLAWFEKLGLTNDEASDLCYPRDISGAWQASSDQGAAVLRLVARGTHPRVAWREVMSE